MQTQEAVNRGFPLKVHSEDTIYLTVNTTETSSGWISASSSRSISGEGIRVEAELRCLVYQIDTTYLFLIFVKQAVPGIKTGY